MLRASWCSSSQQGTGALQGHYVAGHSERSGAQNPDSSSPFHPFSPSESALSSTLAQIPLVGRQAPAHGASGIRNDRGGLSRDHRWGTLPAEAGEAAHARGGSPRQGAGASEETPPERTAAG